MDRFPNTNVSGKAFDAAIIEAVWAKAEISRDHPPLRIDAFGSLIWKEGYGNTASKLGWEIDHKLPVVLGGSDDLENLRPLQWENNRRKGDSYPKLKSLIAA